MKPTLANMESYIPEFIEQWQTEDVIIPAIEFFEQHQQGGFEIGSLFTNSTQNIPAHRLIISKYPLEYAFPRTTITSEQWRNATDDDRTFWGTVCALGFWLGDLY